MLVVSINNATTFGVVDNLRHFCHKCLNYEFCYKCPSYKCLWCCCGRALARGQVNGWHYFTTLNLQGCLAHKKQPPPPGPPFAPRHSHTVGSQGGAVYYERGTSVYPEPCPQSACDSDAAARRSGWSHTEREFFIYNLLVRIHLIIVMIRWTGLTNTF